VYKTQEVNLYTPDSFLVDPCKVTPAGETVRTLARGYISNTSCLKQYQLLIQKQRDWKKSQIDLHEKKDK